MVNWKASPSPGTSPGVRAAIPSPCGFSESLPPAFPSPCGLGLSLRPGCCLTRPPSLLAPRLRDGPADSDPVARLLPGTRPRRRRGHSGARAALRASGEGGQRGGTLRSDPPGDSEICLKWLMVSCSLNRSRAGPDPAFRVDAGEACLRGGCGPQPVTL